MLKLNLQRGKPSVNIRPIKPWAAGLLAFIFLCQSGFYYQKHSEVQRRQLEIKTLSTQLQALKERKKGMEVPDDLDSINGAIYARNEWLKQREKSPVILLSRLEKERPGAVDLKGFETDGSKGTIKMIAGDLDSASRYMNAVFGNANVRVAMEERVVNGIIAGCIWTD